ncbi:MAG: hypothetical protein RI893_108, partial [Pseudomonadota bacterium]
MLNKNTDSLSLKILVAAISLVFSASVAAGNDHGKNNDENHVETHASNHGKNNDENHVETHASNHVENHGNLASSSKTKLKSYLTSGVEP